jgi:hypothetical protein
MEKFKEWLEDAYWHWRNVFYFRFSEYNDDIDRLAFFEELNYGWYQMYIYVQPDLTHTIYQVETLTILM